MGRPSGGNSNSSPAFPPPSMTQKLQGSLSAWEAAIPPGSGSHNVHATSSSQLTMPIQFSLNLFHFGVPTSSDRRLHAANFPRSRLIHYHGVS